MRLIDADELQKEYVVQNVAVNTKNAEMMEIVCLAILFSIHQQ